MMMKRILAFALLALMLAALPGCAAPDPKEASAAEPVPAATPAPAAKAPAERTPEPTSAAVERLPGMSPHFPADRISLPPGSKVLDVFQGETTEYSMGDYIEITVIELPLTKTEAVEYFTPMLDDGNGDFTLAEELSHWNPEAITSAYPEATSYTKLGAYYAHSANIRGIFVQLFTEEGGEKVYAAYIEVSYANDPTTTAPAPTELSMASLRQVFKDMNYGTSEGEYPFMPTGGITPVDGFDMNYEQKSGVWANIIFIEFKDAADLETYVKYREGYALSMTYGLIYVEYYEDTDEVRGFIQDAVKAAGGK